MSLQKNHLGLSILLAACVGGSYTEAVLAANYIIFDDTSYPISDLSTFAETGQETSLITNFVAIKQPDSSLQEMQEGLSRKIDVDVDRIGDMTVKGLHPKDRKWITETFRGITDQELRDTTQAIHDRGQDVTVINFIENFPLETITSQSALNNLLSQSITADPPASEPNNSLTNILYLNSIRGKNTSTFGAYRSTVANTLSNYQDGSVFSVNYIHTHQTGDLATLLNENPLDHYDQIWFDTAIKHSGLLNQDDLDALNAWSKKSQPEFILDTSFVFRNNRTPTVTASAASATVNQALALQGVGGGIFIGTDGEPFAHTANQILENFGFDGRFTGNTFITADGEFIGDLALLPETVGPEFFRYNLANVSTTNIPIGIHTLNENAGNRTIELREHLYSMNTRGERVSLIASSFEFGNRRSDITDPQPVPEPSALFSILALSSLGLVIRKR